jgi:hypothetical protein
MYILLIRQVHEIRLPVRTPRVVAVTPSVLTRAVGHVDHDGDNGEDVGAEDSAHAEDVEGGLRGEKELGTGDVGDAVGCEDDGVDSDLFGVAAGKGKGLVGLGVRNGGLTQCWPCSSQEPRCRGRGRSTTCRGRRGGHIDCSAEGRRERPRRSCLRCFQ